MLHRDERIEFCSAFDAAAWHANTERYCKSGRVPVLRSLIAGLAASLVVGLPCWGQTKSSADAAATYSLEWSQMPPLPDPIGFAGPFVGVAGDALIVAGGANFPEAAPWDGGTKVWHDRVFVLPQPTGPWFEAGRLTQPLGYGVAVSWRDRMILIGGGDAQRHSPAVTELHWDGRSIQTAELPDLPQPCAFMTGLLLGDSIFIAGGIEAPERADALPTLWSLNLSAPPSERKWVSLPPLKTGRILAQSAVVDGRLLIAGGAALFRDGDGKVQRKFLRDAWLFDVERKRWSRAADLPRSIVAAPSPGIPIGESAVAFLSGDDGRYFGQDLKYEHPGFPVETYAYDARVDHWSVTTPFPKSLPNNLGPRHNRGSWPPVTTGTVKWRGGFVIASGEIRPAVRSPLVFSVRAVAAGSR
ncbi:galactose oxidase [bacterium]|nr:galactose oxidase [bacterium]